jgi:hypothetical protein
MRGVIVERTVSAPNQFTEGLAIEPGRSAAISVVPSGFAGTVTLQRSLDGAAWFDVKAWVDLGAEGSYDAEVYQLLRLGVKTGQFSLGSVQLRIES